MPSDLGAYHPRPTIAFDPMSSPADLPETLILLSIWVPRPDRKLVVIQYDVRSRLIPFDPHPISENGGYPTRLPLIWVPCPDRKWVVTRHDLHANSIPILSPKKFGSFKSGYDNLIIDIRHRVSDTLKRVRMLLVGPVDLKVC